MIKPCAGLLALVLALPVNAAGVDLAKSSLNFSFRQMGVPVAGSFGRFDADVAFNAAEPAKSRATLTVHTASIRLPAPDAVAEAAKAAWFDVARHPQARFVASRFTRLADGRYQVFGRLTLKGISRDISAPFALREAGGTRWLEGALPISRLAFGVGDGQWRDTDTVADTVELKFRLALSGR
ncbi:YceI family protein [Crenobacter caeni]|uniref:YceI family protein n=1 Tax=Crenobacter caeni TaxID=2705474 RepID=A0A6B2KQT0_9NEIS|nr:YceI family protein [Crenobacter caeni]NDV12596.1 YceI family protein [Crenobacter caeni]